MAKVGKTFFVLVLVNFLSLTGISHAARGGKKNHFSVQGMVYCDTCRVQFITRVSHVVEGATVKLECRNITAGTVSYNEEAATDKLGLYSFTVEGDHEDDICEVGLVKSPIESCSEIAADVVTQQAAMVSLTSNNGETSDIRYANPLGFMKKDPLPECPEVLKELDMDEDSEGEDGSGHEGNGHDTGGSTQS
ncbi:hypothetical protein Cgig2_010027 [Carnegiea gigantea]|uniref:Olee1-like protein n=1 Tax=Carnegiea gigantea TaxID=171969 RepID=A0A9Q1K367_9CARY|nr:hypothetical protein Cgig2_010027 [Carnegiea gigantea]